MAKFYTGAIPDLPDKRDYKYELLSGKTEPFDWSKGFNIEEYVGKLKVEGQGSSGSCVAQAWSKYAEVLEILENKKFTDLSAKDIYQRIFQEQGGAYIRDGAKLLYSIGVNKEEVVPSYIEDKEPTEEYMRKYMSGNVKEAFNYSAKHYAKVERISIDHIAQVIRDNNGCVSGFSGDNAGWGTAFVKPPKVRVWGHAVYLGKAKLINGKKYIGFINSWGTNWGDNGWGWFEEDYLNMMFNLWTLVDKLTKKKMKLIMDSETKRQYAVGEDGVPHWVFNETMLNQLHNAGAINKNEVEIRDDFDTSRVGEPWAVIKQ